MKRLDIGEWQLEVRGRDLGMTVKRTTFGVTIKNSLTGEVQYLGGFGTEEEAISAARQKIATPPPQPKYRLKKMREFALQQKHRFD